VIDDEETRRKRKEKKYNIEIQLSRPKEQLKLKQ
jgi:hypothetical protein